MLGKDRATVITGGGRGIGRAISRRMGMETAVIVVGRDENDLDSICNEIMDAGGNATPCPGDVTSPETAVHALELAQKHGWILQNLVCNAGIGKSGPTASFNVQLWLQIFDVNVHGYFHFIQACIPEMVKQGGGTVCLMSSISGLKGYKRDAAYTATKHAIIGIARVLAKEYGKHGITAFPICPGFVASDMTSRTINRLMKHRSITEREATAIIASTNPQNRIIPPEEVAELIAFLCSGKVPSLSGNPLILTGGE